MSAVEPEFERPKPSAVQLSQQHLTPPFSAPPPPGRHSYHDVLNTSGRLGFKEGLAYLTASAGIALSLLDLHSPKLSGVMGALYLISLLLNNQPLYLSAPTRSSEVTSERAERLTLLIISAVFFVNSLFPSLSLTFAPFGALIVAITWVLSPARHQLVMLFLVIILEVNATLRSNLVLIEALQHAMTYGLILLLISALSQQLTAHLPRALKGEPYALDSFESDELPIEPPSPYASPQLTPMPSPTRPSLLHREPHDPFLPADPPLQAVAPHPSLLEPLRIEGLDREGGELEEGELEGGEESAALPSRAGDEGDVELLHPHRHAVLSDPSWSDELTHNALTDTPSDMMAQADGSRSGEHDLGLTTREVQPFEAPEDELELSSVTRAIRERHVDFLKHSFEVLLTHLGELCEARSVVLVWRRHRGGGREGAVRWRWTRRPSQAWRASYFEMDTPLISELSQASQPVSKQRSQGWDGQLPYYQGVEAGSLLAIPVCVTPQGGSDGLLMIDKDEDEPWSELARQATFDLSQKISLDVENSRFMKQIVYNNGLFEAMLFGLSGINVSHSEQSFTAALIRAIRVHEVCAWVCVCRLSGEEVVILGQWSAHGEVQLSHESFELGEDLISQCVRSRDKLPLGGLVKERDIRHIFPFPVEGLEHVVNARITPLMDSDGEAHGVVVLGVEHSAQLDQAYMNPIDLVMKEAATKLALLHAHERLRYLATIDGLTGLKNHITFQRDLEEMFKRAERAEGEICLILLDIDHFKKINDQEGHPFGDLVLREVAATLKRGTRAVDVVARYGGEEFGLALEATSLKDAVQTAERAREQVKELSFQGKKGALSVSISLGIAHYPVDAQTQKQLIELADQALYKAKALGRDRALCWGELQGELQGEPLIKGEHSSDERAMSSKELGSRASGSRPALKGLDALIRPSQDQLNAPAPPQALDSPKEEALSELKPSTSPLNTDQGASS